MNKISFYFRYILSVMAGVFMLSGCVEEFEAELPKKDATLLVVSGTIVSDTLNTFKLSWTTPLNSDMVETLYDKNNNPYTVTTVNPVRYATVKVCGSDGSEYECSELADSMGTDGAGVYQCILPKLNKDVEYHLSIREGIDFYESTPEKPLSTPEIEELSYVQEDSLSDIDFVVTTEKTDDSDQINYFIWDYDETWEVHPRYYSSFTIVIDTYRIEPKWLGQGVVYPERGWKFGRNKEILIGSTVHYPDGRFHRYKIYDIPRDDERIFWNYCSHLTQRAISKAEYEYHQATYQAGWEMGGLFTPQPAALPSNIHCTTSSKKVIGYVGCSMNTVAFRGYLDGKKISRELQKPAPIQKDLNPSDPEILTRLKNHKLLYIYEKVASTTEAGDNKYYWWADDVDIDIRLEGAITERPWYMPPFDGVYDD